MVQTAKRRKQNLYVLVRPGVAILASFQTWQCIRDYSLQQRNQNLSNMLLIWKCAARKLFKINQLHRISKSFRINSYKLAGGGFHFTLKNIRLVTSQFRDSQTADMTSAAPGVNYKATKNASIHNKYFFFGLKVGREKKVITYLFPIFIALKRSL